MAKFSKFEILNAAKLKLNGGGGAIFHREMSKFAYFNSLRIILKIVKTTVTKVEHFWWKVNAGVSTMKTNSGGWIDGWSKSHFKDCLQQSTTQVKFSIWKDCHSISSNLMPSKRPEFKFWLKLWSNWLIIDFFDPNSWNLIESSWQNWLNWIQIFRRQAEVVIPLTVKDM